MGKTDKETKETIATLRKIQKVERELIAWRIEREALEARIPVQNWHPLLNLWDLVSIWQQEEQDGDIQAKLNAIKDNVAEFLERNTGK
jgi:hypothetical protein